MSRGKELVVRDLAYLRANRARRDELAAIARRKERAFPSADTLERKGLAVLSKLIDDGRPPTIAGLCLGLNVSTATWYKYESGVMGEEYLEPIAKLKTAMLADSNEKMLTGEYNAPGSIFNLKNTHGWRDQVDVNATVRAHVSAEPMNDVEWAEKYGKKVE